MTTVPETTPGATEYRVTTLELFFDLVFAFAITQLTGLFAGQMNQGGPVHLLGGAGEVLLPFGVLWWMYGGYAWLTNTLRPCLDAVRIMLLLGMAGFFVVALAMPHAFQRNGGVAWGLGYLVVVLVHGALYARANRNIRRVTPVNVLAALLVIAAGLVGHGAAVYLLWTAALTLPIGMPYVIRPGGIFTLQAAHIVERHGAVILITFGESVLDIGIGATGKALPPGTIFAAVIGLALVAGLWWSYFAADDERVEESLTRADDQSRTGMIMHGYFYAHLPIVLGVLIMAAGLRAAIAEPFDPLAVNPAIALGGGLTLYLLGDCWFRRIMRTGPTPYRPAAAVAALPLVALGRLGSIAELIAMALLVAAMLIGERRARLVAERRGRIVSEREGLSTPTTWEN
jgi:low temperature requirement protein LtrA